MSLRIELPWPAPVLSPNWTGKLRHKLRAKALARDAGYYLALEALQAGGLNLDGDTCPPAKPAGRCGGRCQGRTDIPVQVTFHPPDRRRRDRDNFQAALKHQFDGIALALGVDDALFRPIYAWGEVGQPGRVIVTIG